MTAKKLHQLNLKTCADLQKFSLLQLTDLFGKLGQQLYEQCRGQDHRVVEPNRVRKSLSVEETFLEDIVSLDTGLNMIQELHAQLLKRLQDHAPARLIKSQYLKIKYSDFKRSGMETLSATAHLETYLKFFRDLYQNKPQPIRLLGVGVRFFEEPLGMEVLQQALF